LTNFSSSRFGRKAALADNASVPRTYFHVTSALNRVSIQQYGLDWRRMGLAPGIAGSRQPEEDGIFLVNDEFSVEWFAHMGLEGEHESVDVWAVTLTDDPEIDEETEYPLIAKPIPPEAIRLHTAAWTSRDPGAVAGDLFHEIYSGDGDDLKDLIREDVVLVDVEGQEHRGRAGVSEWARSRAHGQPAPPQPEQRRDGTVVIELQTIGTGGFAIEGLTGGRCLVSPEADGDFWTLVKVEDNQVVDIREFRERDEALGTARLDAEG
jgi:hypothetical protein